MAMARSTRKFLDFALVSMGKVRPAVSKVWGYTKGYIMETRGKPLVCNRGVDKLEEIIDRTASKLYINIESLRDEQLSKEAKYLEEELNEIKRKIDCVQKKPTNPSNADVKSKCVSKSFRHAAATSWKYLKVEAIPPFTYNFFHGAPGRKLESIVGNFANGIVRGIETRIKEIDAEEKRTIRELEAAIKAYEEKAKADAMKKEAERLKAQAEKAAEAVKKAKAEAEQKRAEAEAAKAKEKPKEPPKKKPKKAVKGRRKRKGRGRKKK